MKKHMVSKTKGLHRRLPVQEASQTSERPYSLTPFSSPAFYLPFSTNPHQSSVPLSWEVWSYFFVFGAIYMYLSHTPFSLLHGFPFQLMIDSYPSTCLRKPLPISGQPGLPSVFLFSIYFQKFKIFILICAIWRFPCSFILGFFPLSVWKILDMTTGVFISFSEENYEDRSISWPMSFVLSL
jgi:hypothetical protein